MECKTKYFKAVRILKDGRRVSSFISDEVDSGFLNHDMTKPEMLEYSLGKVTVAPGNSEGVFLYPRTMMEAINLILWNVCRGDSKNLRVNNYTSVVELYEVQAANKSSIFRYPLNARCQAIRLKRLIGTLP